MSTLINLFGKDWLISTIVRQILIIIRDLWRNPSFCHDWRWHTTSESTVCSLPSHYFLINSIGTSILIKLSQNECLEISNCEHFKSTTHKLVKQHKVHLFRTFSGLASRKIKPGRLSLAFFFLAVKNDIFEICIHKIAVFILLHLSFWLFFRNWGSNKMSIRQQLTHLRINSMKHESSRHDNLRIFTTWKKWNKAPSHDKLKH